MESSDPSILEFSVEKSVAKIALCCSDFDEPPRVTKTTLQQLVEAIEGDRRVAAIVVKVTGRSDASGAPDACGERYALEEMRASLMRIASLPYPVIAIADGMMSRVLTDFVASCDFVLATPSTGFEIEYDDVNEIPAKILRQFMQKYHCERIIDYSSLRNTVSALRAHSLDFCQLIASASAIEEMADSVANILVCGPGEMFTILKAKSRSYA